MNWKPRTIKGITATPLPYEACNAEGRYVQLWKHCGTGKALEYTNSGFRPFTACEGTVAIPLAA